MDGSRRESIKLSGAGIFYSTMPEKKHIISLGKFASVFQAVTYAIMACANSFIDTLSTENKFIIYSDSQAVLKALKRKDTTSALVKECKNTLNSLAERTKVLIVWVPGHLGSPDKEKADELARLGTSIEL
ncbi:jg11596 [Pararge aegeria aegeria]|uniref:Jg11596 protein n=1 Tax=Pararge aegeria aegeria TaxID=348720 RepID=A0A8S4RTD3_9NEOP|nr:jg11596 [Pararge aegeria aegeria]